MAAGGPSAEVAKWVEQTGAQCDAAYLREVKGPFDAGLDVLRKNYMATVMQAMETASQARKLDEANLFRMEREKFLGAGHKPPDDDSDKPADGVKAIRSTFRNQFTKLDLERFNRARVLFSRCDPTLAQMELQLTQRQRMADAALVKAKRAELAKVWLQPPAPVAGAPAAGITTRGPTQSKPEVNRGTIREAVEWVFSTGGTVALPDGKDGKGEKEIGDASQLPNGPTIIAHLVLDNAKASNPLQDADLAPLAGLRNVRYLDFRGVQVTDAGLGFLDGWKELEKIHLMGPKVTDAVVARFARFENLHSLHIHGAPDLTGKTFDKLLNLRTLHSLDLEKCGLTDEGLGMIAQIKGIDELLLPKTEITDAGVAHLAAMHSVHKLQIQETQVTSTGLGQLAPLRDLEELGFLTSTLPDYGGAVKQIASTWPKLKSLRFVGGEVRGAQIEPLAILKGIKELHLQSVEVGEGAIAALGKLPALDDLSITYGTFDDARLADVVGLKKLRILRLNNTKVTDAGLLKLKPMKGLKELDVHTTPVTAAGVAAFEKELPGCKVLR